MIRPCSPHACRLPGGACTDPASLTSWALLLPLPFLILVATRILANVGQDPRWQAVLQALVILRLRRRRDLGHLDEDVCVAGLIGPSLAYQSLPQKLPEVVGSDVDLGKLPEAPSDALAAAAGPNDTDSPTSTLLVPVA